MPDKNTGPFLAFSKGWFKKHQRGLLFLCNAPLIKYWFRWVLRIHKFDCPLDVKITELAPSHFSYGDKLIFDVKDGKLKRQRTTDFRTHPKFAKRIYFAFKPMWWAFHAWDWLIADRFVPEWSFGFSTLTVYPDAGDPGTTSCDGPIGRLNDKDTWSQIRDGAGNTKDQTDTEPNWVVMSGGSDGTGFGSLGRGHLGFDTSNLTSGATISAATESIRGTDNTNQTTASPAINIYASSPASNTAMANSDYGNFGTTAYCNTKIAIASWSKTGYNDFAFNATGLSAINKTGVTNTGLREANYDAPNTSPGILGNLFFRFTGYSADYTGTSSDPKLVVTYTAITDLAVSVYDSVTVSEDVNHDLQLNPSVVDTVTITENLNTDNQLNPFVFDTVTLSEEISGQMDLGNISVFDAVSVADVITAQMNLGDISVFDTVTVVESITIANEYFQYFLDVSVFEDIAVSESIILNIDLGDIAVFEEITVTDNSATEVNLGDISVYEDISVSDIHLLELLFNISVFDTVNVTESVTLLVTARRDGWIVNLRSEQQKYPLSMDQNDTRKMRSFEQDSPKSMDTTDIL